MNINDNMQPTSSASSADKLAELIRKIDGNHSMGAAALAEALLPHLAGIVPQVVQAPIDTNFVMTPIELTREMWAAAGDAVVNLGDAHHDKIVDAVYSAIKAASAPIVATVPSEQASFTHSNNQGIDMKNTISNCSDERPCLPCYLDQGACEVSPNAKSLILQFENGTAEKDFHAWGADVCKLLGEGEQASDVRNAALERAAERCDTYANYQHRNNNLREASTSDYLAAEIRALKSATPADKGNAPAEANEQTTKGENK